MQTHNFPILKDEVTFDSVQKRVPKLQVFLCLSKKMFGTVQKKLVCKVKGTARRSCVGILPKTNLKTSQDGYKTKMGIMPKTSLKSSRGKFLGSCPKATLNYSRDRSQMIIWDCAQTKSQEL